MNQLTSYTMQHHKPMSVSEIQSDPEKVKIINRVFHDFDADTYENEHPEIYDLERASWKELMEGPLAPIVSKQDVVILDIGTGNGFVIDVITPFVLPTHTVIFSDISQKMVDIVSEKFKNHDFKKEFIVTEAAHIPYPTESIDLITVNSVLHHIPNHEEFLAEAKRLLRPGGALLIKHEPNVRFPRNTTLRSLYLFVNKMKGRGDQNKPKPVDQKLLDALEQEGVSFIEPVTKQQLQSLVDISSPTAGGGMDMERGFDPYNIVSRVFPEATESRISTYAYLGKYNEKKNIITQLVAGVLKFVFPKDGYLFDLIVIK